jgi:hypothetical protein
MLDTILLNGRNLSSARAEQFAVLAIGPIELERSNKSVKLTGNALVADWRCFVVGE